MKRKSKYISVLILIFILFSITAVSASENQTAAIGDDDNYVSEQSDSLKANQIDDSNQNPLCASSIDEENDVESDIENSDSAILGADDENSFI